MLTVIALTGAYALTGLLIRQMERRRKLAKAQDEWESWEEEAAVVSQEGVRNTIPDAFQAIVPQGYRIAKYEDKYVAEFFNGSRKWAGIRLEDATDGSYYNDTVYKNLYHTDDYEEARSAIKRHFDRQNVVPPEPVTPVIVSRQEPARRHITRKRNAHTGEYEPAHGYTLKPSYRKTKAQREADFLFGASYDDEVPF